MTREKWTPSEDYYQSVGLNTPNRLFHDVALHTVASLVRVKQGPITIVGDENLSGLDTPVIFGSHHTSNLDYVPTIEAINRVGHRYTSPLGKAALFRNPAFRFVLGNLLGGHAVEKRGSSPEVLSAFQDARLSILDSGRSLLDFVQGTRSKDDPREVLEPKTGAIFTASESGLPIVPMSFAGVHKTERCGIRSGFNGKSSPLGFGLPVVVAFGEPIEVDDFFDRSLERQDPARSLYYKGILRDSINDCTELAYKIRDDS